MRSRRGGRPERQVVRAVMVVVHHHELLAAEERHLPVAELLDRLGQCQRDLAQSLDGVGGHAGAARTLASGLIGAGQQPPPDRGAPRRAAPGRHHPEGRADRGQPLGVPVQIVGARPDPARPLVDLLDEPLLARQPAPHVVGRRVDDDLDLVPPALGEVLLDGGDRVEAGGFIERLLELSTSATRSIRRIRRASTVCDQPSRYHLPNRTTIAHGSTSMSRTLSGPSR